MKICKVCSSAHEDNYFYKYHRECKRCTIEKTKEWKHNNRDKISFSNKKWNANHPGYYNKRRYVRGERIPLGENKKCASYLGVYIAERVLSNYFDNVTRMKSNNPGYDFICSKGYKVDVKSSCLTKNNVWSFHINRNNIPDAFLCLAFNNRESLDPMYVWLIPSNVISGLVGLGISNGPRSLRKWLKYERPIEKVLIQCNKIKTEGF